MVAILNPDLAAASAMRMSSSDHYLCLNYQAKVTSGQGIF
jgi:hypothetical protein